MRTVSAAWQAWASGGAVAAAGLARTAYLRTNLDLAITDIPDDAFYYLKLASNFAHSGQWSFDGTAPTSGFHLLHAYLLAFASPILGDRALDWPYMLIVVGAFASLCMGFATTLLVRVAQRVYPEAAAWWVVPVMLTPVAVNAATMLMESHLVVLAGAIVFYAITGTAQPRWTTGFGLIMLGFLTALSRLDFALLPGVAWVAFRVRARVQPVNARRADLVFAGTLAGFAVTLAHTWAVSGTLLPTSATAKLSWSLAKPVQFLVALQVLDIVLIALLLALAVSGTRRGRASWFHDTPVTLASVLGLLGYAAFYGTATSGAQKWYLTSMLVPAALLLAAIGGQVAQRAGRLVTTIVASALAVGCLALSVVGSAAPIWPWQIGMLHAAQEVGADPSIERVGAWNAGIMSVVSGKPVTNLDGLVDDRAAAAGRAGALFDYLRARNIDHLADAESIVKVDEAGAVDPRVARCYVKVWRLSGDSDPNTAGGPVWLFAYQPGCG